MSKTRQEEFSRAENRTPEKEAPDLINTHNRVCALRSKMIRKRLRERARREPGARLTQSLKEKYEVQSRYPIYADSVGSLTSTEGAAVDAKSALR